MRVNPNFFENTNPKNVDFVGMWSLLEDALCYKNYNLILHLCDHCKQEVTIQGWSFTQV